MGNPVHCLRSALVHNHDPPCMPFMPGKQYLILPCPDAGCFYDGRSLKMDPNEREEQLRKEGFGSRALVDIKDFFGKAPLEALPDRAAEKFESSEEDASSDEGGLELMRNG